MPELTLLSNIVLAVSASLLIGTLGTLGAVLVRAGTRVRVKVKGKLSPEGFKTTGTVLLGLVGGLGGGLATSIAPESRNSGWKWVVPIVLAASVAASEMVYAAARRGKLKLDHEIPDGRTERDSTN